MKNQHPLSFIPVPVQKKLRLFVCCAGFVWLGSEALPAQVFSETFESGGVGWTTTGTGGVWAIGVPNYGFGPPAAYSPANCAGTNLTGQYPDNADARLISPSIALPFLSGNQTLKLGFYHWFDMAKATDYGNVEVSAGGGPWQKINVDSFTFQGGNWTHYRADLSAFAGTTVQVAFHFISAPSGSNAAGWYVDQVKVEVDAAAYALPYLEDFEDGAEDWYASSGGLSVGKPNYAFGPPAAYEQMNCAGTNLTGQYPANANTRLLSPVIPLPGITGNEKIKLSFYQWFYTAEAADYGYAEVSVGGGPWQKINVDSFTWESGGWTHYLADLSAYAGSSIQLGFHFRSNSTTNSEAGWYVDRVRLTVESSTYGLPYVEDFEDGAEDWYTSSGGFSVGKPNYAFGPPAAYEQVNCAGTNLTGQYSRNANTRLLSPAIPLPTLSGNERIRLSFYQWFYTAEAADYGDVEVSAGGGPWQKINMDSFTWESGSWTHYLADLSAYAGSSIQLGFHFRSNSTTNSEAGWYVDRVSVTVESFTYTLPYLEDFEDGAGDWYATVGGFSVGKPMYAFGPSAAYEQMNCAGTNLTGNYPRSANTRLLSPSIPLPTLSGNERIKLGFYQWFYTAEAVDYGNLEVSAGGGPWQKINVDSFTWESGGWTHYLADLSAYAGSSIQLGFHFRSNSTTNSEAGWYVDRVSVTVESFTYTLPYLEDFEDGAGDWYATVGGFSVGKPMYAFGPSAAYEQMNCVGTNLTGNYPRNANTRLLSPSIPLPTLSGNERIKLSFYQWFYTAEAVDYGNLEVSAGGGPWQKINVDSFTWESGGWTHYLVDLSAYAGSSIQLGFHFRSNSTTNSEAGWYVDRVSVTVESFTYGLPYLEDFEDGAGDWYATVGGFSVGKPMYAFGPSAAYEQMNCAGTNLTGDYPRSANTRLLSPSIPLPALNGNEKIKLSFYQWFYTVEAVDYGDVEVSVSGGAWQKVSLDSVNRQSGSWTHYLIDLSAFAGAAVQLAFHFRSNATTNSEAGWYIDRVRIAFDTTRFDVTQPEAFSTATENWYAGRGVWQVGAPAYTFGPSAANSPTRCLGTVLNGAYPNNARSRFISPAFPLSANDVNNPPRLVFWHWYKTAAGDTGRVQISLDGGPWQTLSPGYTGNKANWSKDSVSLAPYTGHEVRIAFLFESNTTGTDAGWYLDDLDFVGVCPSLHNIAAVDILVPNGIVNKDTMLMPAVVVKNYTGSPVVYTATLAVGSLYSTDTVLAAAAFALDTVYFPPFIAGQAGAFPVTFNVRLNDDFCPGNDEREAVLTVNPGTGPLITGIAPNQGGNTGSITVAVSGQFFQAGADMFLTAGLQTIHAYNIVWVNAGQLFASFDLSGQALGAYDVHVINPDFQETMLEDGFAVVDGSIGWGGVASSVCAANNFDVGQLLRIDIARPTAARPNRVVPLTVIYKNVGNIDIPVPVRILVSLSGAPLAYTEAGLAENKTELFLELRESGGPANVLRAGAGGSIKVYTRSPATQQTMQFKLME